MTKRQTMIYIYKAQHRILKIEQGEHHKIPRMIPGIPERLAVPARLVTPVVLLSVLCFVDINHCLSFCHFIF
jgi:hypothetical protein